MRIDLGKLTNSIKHNICIRVPKEEREKEAENVFEEIIADNFPNQGRKQTSRSRRHRELPSNQQSRPGAPGWLSWLSVQLQFRS